MSKHERTIRLRRREQSLVLNRRQANADLVLPSLLGLNFGATGHTGGIVSGLECSAKITAYGPFDEELEWIYDGLAMDDAKERDNEVRVRLTDDEKRLIDAASRIDGERIAAWARRQLVRVARRALRGGGR